MRSAERASALKLLRHPGFAREASATFARAVAVTETLAGFDIDFSFAELAVLSVKIDGNGVRARELAGKIRMDELRRKVLAVVSEPAR